MRTATLCTVFYVLNLTQSVVNRITAWYTINLTSRRPGVHKMLFPVAHQEHSSTEQHSTTALRYSRYRLTAWFLRDPYEVFTRSIRDRDLTRQGSRARQQRTFLIFHSLLYASLITSTLQFDSLLYSSVYSLFYSPLLFYCSLFSVSQAIEKPSPWVSISKRICLRNMCAPAKC